MRLPWQLPGYELAHHALPLANGWWRGPKASGQQALQQLARSGLHFQQSLADGAAAYAIGPEFRPQDFDHCLVQPQSPGWIAQRIAVGWCAYHASTSPSVFMAILNLTEDSFSDGGANSAAEPLMVAARTAVQQGASWLDLGAESTRPGAVNVGAADQLARLLPALEQLLPLGVPISIDTRSAEVARACLAAGARMINDVSALSDPEMAALCGQQSCPVVLMHMRGTPQDMQTHAQYKDLLGEVADELCQRVASGIQQGLAGSQIILDPGIGFAKTAQQSRQLLAQIDAFRALGLPLLVGPSRKSFMADLLPGLPAQDRDCGSVGAAALCAMQGVAILRLHSGAYFDAVRVANGISATREAILSTASPCPTQD